MDILYTIVSGILSILIFTLLFDGLNKSRLHLFVPVQKFTSKLKRKKLYYGVIAVLFIVLSFFITTFFHLNYVGYGTILGALISLNDVIFDSALNLRRKPRKNKQTA
jgi:TctA family transporter